MPRIWPLFLILAVAAGSYLLCFNTLQVGQHVDDASYVMLAQSLLSGHGYHQIAYPGAPVDTRYPPVLPLLILPFLWLTHGALWATRLPAFLCALACIPVLYLLLRRLVEGPALWLLVALVSLHPLVVGYAGMAMTEAPSLLVTWTVLLLALDGEQEGPRCRWLLVGVLLALGMLLRTDLLALVVAVAALLLLRRQWRQAALVAIVALLPAILWHWYVSHGTTSIGYVQELQTGWWDRSPLPLRLWHALAGYVGDYVPQTVGLIFGSAVDKAATARGLLPVIVAVKWALGLLTLAGFVKSWRRLPPLAGWFTVLRMGMLSLWPVVTRYLLPLLPLLLLYLASALSRRRDADQTPWSPRVAALLFGLLLLPALGRDALLVRHPPSRDYPNLVVGGKLIAERTPPDAVVLCSWSAKSYFLHCGRTVVELPAPPDQQVTAQYLLTHANGAGYALLAGQYSAGAFGEAELLRSPRLRLLGRTPEGDLLLQIIAPAPPSPLRPAG